MGEPQPKPPEKKPLLGVFDTRLQRGLDLPELAQSLLEHAVAVVCLLAVWFDGHGYRDPNQDGREEAYAAELRKRGIEVQVYGWPAWRRGPAGETPEQMVRRWARGMADHVWRLGATVCLIDFEDRTLLRLDPDEGVDAAELDRRALVILNALEDELHRLEEEHGHVCEIGLTFFHPPETPGLRALLGRVRLVYLQTYKGTPERADRRVREVRAAAPHLVIVPCPPAYGANSGRALEGFIGGSEEMAEAPLLMVWRRNQIDEVEWETLEARTQAPPERRAA